MSPPMIDVLDICDGAYTSIHVLQMEVLQLTTLDFQYVHRNLIQFSTVLTRHRVSRVHSLHFLRNFSRASDCDQKTHNLAKYLCELSLLDSDIQPLPTSMLAAASVFAARKMLGVRPQPWVSHRDHLQRGKILRKSRVWTWSSTRAMTSMTSGRSLIVYIYCSAPRRWQRSNR